MENLKIKERICNIPTSTGFLNFENNYYEHGQF